MNTFTLIEIGVSVSNFYTSVTLIRDKIYLRGFENGRRIQREIKYKPHFYVAAKNNVASDHKSIDGRDLSRIDFNNVWEARDFYKKYKDVAGFEIFGMEKFDFAFIQENYPGHIDYDASLINKVFIDIETEIGTSFPDIQAADKMITAITMMRNETIVTFGYQDYTPKDPRVTFLKCGDERELLHKFLTVWEKWVVDVVGGHNIEFFDIPYIVNRISRILGVEYAKRLSPFNILDEKTVTYFGKDNQTYVPVGVSILDNLQLYKKFASQRAGQDSFKESNALDYIANKELGEAKVDYSGYGNLDDLYKKNYELFIDYNIHDVVLVHKLEEKLKYIELIFAIAYDAHVNYNDAFTTVQLWDAIIYNYLMEKKIVIPKHQKKFDRRIAGGYVKDSIVGMHDWVVSFDLRSLYPSLIMGVNISPETFRGKVHDYSVDQLLEGSWSNDTPFSVAASGCAFARDVQGFLPALMEQKFAQRDEAKRLKLAKEDEFEHTKDKSLENDIAKYDGRQLAIKIQSNALFGSLSNIAFRFFDPDLAESITLTGQLAIKFIGKKFNDYLNKLTKTDEDYDWVVHTDTDSVLLRMNRFVDFVYKDNKPDKTKIVNFLDKFAETELEKQIEGWYNELAEYLCMFKNTLEMKREIIADRAIWVAKKRYIANVWDLEGVRYAEPKFKIKGIEAVRSSTPEICRKKIEEAIRIMMEKDEDAVREFINEFKKEFETLPFEEISSPSGVNGIEKYQDSSTIYKQRTPMHVRACLMHNHLLKKKNVVGIPPIYEGQKIRFIALKMPNPLHEDVIAAAEKLPKEFELDEYIDYDAQFDKTFLTPIKHILTAIGWSYERNSSLGAFW